MIVVVGRPAVRPLAGHAAPGGRAGRIALAAAAAGGRVELAGTLGDDTAGDEVAVGLARGGVGHAALLRLRGARTPREGTADPVPRLDAADVELGLGYLAEYQVLVLAEPLGAEAEAVALDAARYHGAAVVAVVEPGAAASAALEAAGTVLAAPRTAAAGAFAELVGRYAAGLAAGTEPGTAFAAARGAAGWEPA